MAIIRT